MTVSPSYGLTATGIPDWLKGAVVRSLNAVWSEIPSSPEIDREGTLELVANRLFTGYAVKVKAAREAPMVKFTLNDAIVTPEVRIILPELRGPALKWFDGDVSGLSDDVASLVSSIPQSALTWSDEALREIVGDLITQRLPGWEFTQQIYVSDGSTLVTLSFRPSAKMVLAVKPSMYSHTIPVMFRSDLEAKLIPELSPLIGVPVKWADAHKSDIEGIVRLSLADRHTVENLRANIMKVKFRADTVSEVDVNADSENFMFQLWVSAYAGMEDRYPEAGVFFGIKPHTSFKPELYCELIFALNDFDVTSRLGLRLETLENLYAGIEYQWPGEEYYLRLQYIPVKIRRPYGMWRYSPSLGTHEAALGYRIDEHVSVEIYYDSTGTDEIGIRGMWHL